MKTTEEKLKFFMENHGKECEFSDTGVEWHVMSLTGFNSDSKYSWFASNLCSYMHIRPIQQPKTKRIPWTPETAPFPLALRRKEWAKGIYWLFEPTNNYVYTVEGREKKSYGTKIFYEDLASEGSEWETREGNPCCDIIEEVE